MPSNLSASLPWLNRSNAWLDRFLQGLVVFFIPTLAAVLSFWALVMWPNAFSTTGGAPLGFYVLHDTQAKLTPAAAVNKLLALAPQGAVLKHETQLSEAPFWLLLRPAQTPNGPAQRIELPSRHLFSLTCWDATTLSPLGSVARSAAPSGALHAARAGFALDPGTAAALVCRALLVGPGSISAVQWDASELSAQELQFQRSAGLLDGGILVLAIFTLLAGLINRNFTYVLFASWLLLNWRMAALSMGVDTHWLGQSIPAAWLQTIRPLTLALYAVVTLALFAALFRQEILLARLQAWVQTLKWSSLPLLPLGLLLPYAHFLPLLWTFSALAALVLIYTLGQILYRAASRMAAWYASSVAVIILSTLYELSAAAMGLRGWIEGFNSLTAALASSLLASLAIAEQMRQALLQRQQAQAQLQQAYAVNPVGLFSLALDGRFYGANPALLQMLECDEQALKLRRWADWFGPVQWEALNQHMAQHGCAELELTRPTPEKNSAERRYQVRAVLSGERIEGSLLDITEKAEVTEHLRFLADHDTLTKVLNRRGIERVLAAALAECAQGQPVAVAYLDLDRFKLINDLYGHATGDAVLQIVCARAQIPLLPSMQLGRVGGDEFLLVLSSTPLAQARAVCRAILEQLSASPCQVGERAFWVRCSIGLVEVLPGSQAREVVLSADHACRLAKKNQNKGLVVFDRGSGQLGEHEAELQLIQRLENQQTIDGLYLLFQPILSLRKPYTIHNFEVLLRMQDENGASVPTSRLLHAAENAGRMGLIDRWVLAQTLSWIETHASALTHTQFVCVNLSGASLNDERFVEDVFVMFEQHPQAAQRVCLEITESVALHDMNNTRHFIDRVRASGSKLALDDFGAGYTSFSYLKNLPADLLKIDGSFIVNMNQHPANVAIVEAIVSLAQNLGMKTIAEWAEDFETVKTLAEIGVDYVQGFVIAHPQTPAALLQTQSGAEFIADAQLKTYLSTLVPGDLDHVDWVLGAPALDGPPWQAPAT